VLVFPALKHAAHVTDRNSNIPAWAKDLLQHHYITPEVYAERAPLEHRQHFGQFFTPSGIAAWMADWVLHPTTRSILDPAVGTGVLIDALLDHPQLPSDAKFTAYDLDPAILAFFDNHLLQRGILNVQSRAQDFLRTDDRTLYDAIVCNPPYLRHRVLADRRTTIAAFEQRWNLKLSAFSNSYLFFILAIAACLSPQGRAAIITPLDYLNANFGVPLRSFLLQSNLLDGLILFDHTQLVFGDLDTTACLLLLRADRTADAPITFAHLLDEHALGPLELLPQRAVAAYAPDTLNPKAKWLSLFPGVVAAPILLSHQQLVPLDQLADVRRGIATGANEFFMLSEAERAYYGIAAHETHLCVTKASHALRLRFTIDDLEELRRAQKKVYLLDLQSKPSSGAAAYLDLGVQRGMHRRYLTAHRQPWYHMEQRPVAPLWINTFSRQGFRCVLNDAQAAHLTAFHGIYPYTAGREYVLTLAAFLNSSIAAPLVAQHQRVYSRGLAKLEPLDVAAILVPDPDQLPAAFRSQVAELHIQRCMAQEASLPEENVLRQQLDRLWLEQLEV